MRRLRGWIVGVGGLLNKRRKDRELDEEVASHLQMHIDDNLRAGMEPEEARREALIKLGGIESTKEAYRDQRGLPALETAWQDVRFAARMLVKSPGFSLVIFITLGLGIGANTAIFSIANGILLCPLPFPAPEELVVVRKDWKPYWAPQGEVSAYAQAGEVLTWQEQNQVLSHLAGYLTEGATLTGSGEAELVKCEKVSASFLSTLGVVPMLGRGFLPEEDRQGGPPVVILSHGLWQRRFGGDAGAVGQAIRLNEKSYTIIGVLSSTFKFLEPIDVLVPLALSRGTPGFAQVIGRLKPGVPLDQARAGLDVIYQGARDPKEPGRVVLTDLREVVVGHVKLSLLCYLGAVGFVLLIACANIANLLLARGARRHKEIAVRIALGAGRLRILRQLLSESVLLALPGGLLGLLVGFWAKGVLGPLIGNRPDLQPARIDFRVLAFTLALTILTGLLFGLAPALESSRLSPNDALKDGSRSGGGGGPRQRRLSGLLVISEVTLALVLLLGAGLLVKTFVRLRGVDLGFRSDRMLSLRIDLSKARYPDARAQAAYFERVIEEIRKLPGVETVGLDAALPLSGYGMMISQSSDKENHPEMVSASIVNAEYFRTMGIVLKKGRLFSEGDRIGMPKVALVNESFARSRFADEDALGKQVLGATVVGVVGDVRQGGPSEPPSPLAYFSYLQSGGESMSLAIRTKTNPMKLAGAIRAQIVSLDKDQPIHGLATMEQRLGETMATQRVNMMLSGVLGTLALGLVAVGIYGVLSFSVAERTHEIGVRIALGAQTADVLRLVIVQGLKLTLAGVFFGLLAGSWLTRFLSSLLWGVRPFDPWTFAAASVFLAGISVLACYLPARRAARLDPMTALRQD